MKRPIETLYRQTYLDIEAARGSRNAFFALARDAGFNPHIAGTDNDLNTLSYVVFGDRLRRGYVDDKGKPKLPRDRGHPEGKTPDLPPNQPLDFKDGYAKCLREILDPAAFFRTRTISPKESRLGSEKPLLMVMGKRNTIRIFRVEDGTAPTS